MACSSCGKRGKGMKISNIVSDINYVVYKGDVVVGEFESRSLARAAMRKAGVGATFKTVSKKDAVKKDNVKVSPQVEGEQKDTATKKGGSGSVKKKGKK